jgi:hypothetical protein
MPQCLAISESRRKDLPVSGRQMKEDGLLPALLVEKGRTLAQEQQPPASPKSTSTDHWPIGLRRLERTLTDRYGAVAPLLNGRERFLLEMKIRMLAVELWASRQIASALKTCARRRTYLGYRQRMREDLRPFGPKEEEIIDELVFLILPRRWDLLALAAASTARLSLGREPHRDYPAFGLAAR